MRVAAHHGPPARERIMVVPVGAVPIEAVLPPGARLLDALAALLREHGAESGALTMSGGGFLPFAYVVPTLTPGGPQLASYSATRRPPGLTRLDAAAVTVGTRDGQPFFHCHALWTAADGTPGCGHVLPDETRIGAPIQVRGTGIIGAQFRVAPDPETGFSLFMPHPTGTPPPPHVTPALALRLAPNQDLAAALEEAGQRAGFRQGIVQGGVGSINEARFMDAPPLRGMATELLIRRGAIRCLAGAGAPTELHAAIVDHTGAIGAGRLAGANPVLMTFECVLEAVA